MKTLGRLLCLLLLFPAAALGQSSRLTERLPADTTCYLLWAGSASLGPARQTNSLFRLWDDPDFAPLRDELTKGFADKFGKSRATSGLEQADLAKFLSVFENPALLALVGPWPYPRTAPGQSADPPKPPRVIAILDLTGKTEIWHALRQKYLDDPSSKRTVTRYTSGAFTLDKVEAPGDISYQAFVGNYFLSSPDRQTLEDFLARFGSEHPQPDSLLQAADYKDFQRRTPDTSLLELFARLPDFSSLAPSGPAGFNAAAFLRALHAEKVRTLGLALSFSGPATRAHISLLGDTTGESPFALVGASRAAFDALAAVPAGSSVSAGTLDLAAVYPLLRRAVLAGLPPDRAGSVDAMENLFAAQAGMLPAEVLKLLGGEFASLWIGPVTETREQLYMISIQDSSGVLSVLRRSLDAVIADETEAPGVTYLSLAIPYVDPETQAQRKRPFTVAVTPHWLLAAPRQSIVRDALRRLAAEAPSGPAAALTADPQFARDRSRFPEKISGLSYTDLSRIDWPKIVAQLAEQAAKQAQQSGPTLNSKTAWFQRINPAALSRNLHAISSGWWKDRDGVHFDAYIE